MTGDSSNTILPYSSSIIPDRTNSRMSNYVCLFLAHIFKDGAAKMFTTNVQVDHAIVQAHWLGDPDKNKMLFEFMAGFLQVVPSTTHLRSPFAQHHPRLFGVGSCRLRQSRLHSFDDVQIIQVRQLELKLCAIQRRFEPPDKWCT